MNTPSMMSAPYGSSTGSALDVIIVVPSNRKRRQSSSTNNNDAPQSQPFNTNTTGVHNTTHNNGVVASSDFFVTFPSNLAPPPSTTTTTTSLRKSISKSKLYRALSSSNLSTKNTNYSRGNSRGSSTNSRLSSSRGSSGGSETIQEELELESQDVTRDSNVHAQSEHGTSSTKEPTNHDQFNTTMSTSEHLPVTSRRKGNVQIQINGRYIPQLDMIFSSNNSNSNGVDGISSNSEPSCRFVVGNGIRPSTSTLEMLLDYDDDDTNVTDTKQKGKEQQTTPVCSCSEAIRNSEHHLCNIVNKQDSSNSQSTTASQNNKQTKSILTPGRNLLRYTLHSPSNTIIASTTCHIYLWSSSDKVIISDVDGTITKSDIRGVYDTIIQDNFTYCHVGICEFFHSLVTESNVSKTDDRTREVEQQDNDHDEGQVRFFYLTARPIRLISQTRKLLQSLKQPCSLSKGSKMYGLPPGPILCNTGALSSVLYSELWAKNTHQFKADACIRQVLLPFVAARGTVNDDLEEDRAGDNNMPQRTSSGLSEASSLYSTAGSSNDRLFIAGFGNKYSDAQTYEMAGLSRKDIYIIDKDSRILCMDDSTPQRLSSSSDPLNSMNMNDWSMTDVCCPGGIDSQLLSELSTPTVPSADGQDDFNNVKRSKASNDEIATSIQSIELSLTEKSQSPDESSIENLTISKTSVEICNVTSDKLGKRQRFKQSIRAFSSKRTSLKKFPSFGSSPDRSKASSKKLFRGYDDPLLLERVRERIMI